MGALAFAVACAVLAVCAWLLPALAADLLTPSAEEERAAAERERRAAMRQRLAETRAEILAERGRQ